MLFRRLFVRGRSVAIGSADSGNVSDVLFEDCTIGDDEGSSPWAFKIKMHVNAPSHVAGITFLNCHFGNITSNTCVGLLSLAPLPFALAAPVLHFHRALLDNQCPGCILSAVWFVPFSWQDAKTYPALQMGMNYGRAVVDPTKGQPRIANISFINVTAAQTTVVGSFVGASAAHIENLHFENCDFQSQAARPWELFNVSVSSCSSEATAPPFPSVAPQAESDKLKTDDAVQNVAPVTTNVSPYIVGDASQPVWRAGLFASMTATGTLNAPAFDSVVLQAAHLPSAPWEAGFTVETLGTNVVRDPDSGNIRMYYTLRWAALDKDGVPVTHTDPKPHMFAIAMAESSDGITFTKPALASKPFSSSLNGANVSESNIICSDQCLSAIWVTEKGPTSDRYWGAAGSKGDMMKIWSSADGIEWRAFGLVPIPSIDNGHGLDTMQSMFYDPGCECHALFTRLWHGHSPGNYTGAFRMVRRASIALSPNGTSNTVTKQQIVLQADAIDLASHKPVLPFPAVGFYGATSWVRDFGAGQLGYFMAPER